MILCLVVIVGMFCWFVNPFPPRPLPASGQGEPFATWQGCGQLRPLAAISDPSRERVFICAVVQGLSRHKKGPFSLGENEPYLFHVP